MIDLYCERLGPGLWAEPVNGLTNLAFFLAAWGAGRLASRSGTRSPGVTGLVVLVAVIGVGSTLFHTFATTWARVLDVVPILIFQLWFLWLYARRVIAAGPGWSGLALAGLVIAALLGRQFHGVFSGSLTYAPGLGVLGGLGVYHWQARKRERLAMLAAAGAFALALVFRTVDGPVCPYVPWGSHFLWHLLVALVIYWSMRGLIRNLPADTPAGAPGRVRGFTPGVGGTGGEGEGCGAAGGPAPVRAERHGGGSS